MDVDLPLCMDFSQSVFTFNSLPISAINFDLAYSLQFNANILFVAFSLLVFFFFVSRCSFSQSSLLLDATILTIGIFEAKTHLGFVLFKVE